MSTYASAQFVTPPIPAWRRLLAAGIALTALLIATVVISLNYYTSHQYFTSHPHPGMTTAQVLALAGKPRIQSAVEVGGVQYFGPHPSQALVQRLQPGTAIPMWHYRLSDGNMTLIFDPVTDRLDSIAFPPKGAVY